MAVEHLFRNVPAAPARPGKVVRGEYTEGNLTTAAGAIGGWELVTWKGGTRAVSDMATDDAGGLGGTGSGAAGRTRENRASSRMMPPGAWLTV